MGVKTLIAVPCFDMVHADFMESLVNLKKPAGTSWTMVKNTLIHEARNIVAANAIEAGFDRVMWFDSDMVFPPDTLLKLSETMDNLNTDGFHSDLVSGLYFTRRPPNIKPVAYKRLWYDDSGAELDTGAENCVDYPESGITPIEGVGMGCCLMTVDIIKRVADAYGSPFSPLDGVGEDLSFCWRARQLGAMMICDTSIKCGHVGQAVYDEAYYKRQGEGR